MHFLHINNAPAAMQIAVEVDRSVWLMKVGYDAQFARCSPGSLLLAETIRDAAERGLATYEFLGASEDWTRVWTETERPTVSLRVCPFRVGSVATLLRGAVTNCFRSRLRGTP
jgi:CelD/BcsL family acetyltransferase involved in cellulose biosynthesis